MTAKNVRSRRELLNLVALWQESLLQPAVGNFHPKTHSFPPWLKSNEHGPPLVENDYSV